MEQTLETQLKKKSTKESGTSKSNDQKRRSGPGGGRQAASPTLALTISLRHSLTIKTFRYWYPSFTECFFSVATMLGKLNAQDGPEMVNEFMGDLIEKELAVMQEGIAALEKAIQASGLEEVPQTVERMKQLPYHVPTNVAKRYAETFITADRLFDHVFAGEIVGAISFKERNRLRHQVFESLKRPPRLYKSVFTKVQQRLVKSEEARQQTAEDVAAKLKAIIEEGANSNQKRTCPFIPQLAELS